jgi:hypothetical protein
MVENDVGFLRGKLAGFYISNTLFLDEEAQAKTLSPTKRLKGKAYREAAGPVLSTESKQQPSAKAKSLNGLIPEVYIDRLRLSSGASATASSAGPSSSAAEETNDEEADSDLPSRKPRRVAAQKAALSLENEGSDSASDAGEKSKASRKTTSGRDKATSKMKAYVLSDDDEYSAEKTTSDEGSEVDWAVSSDDEAKKKSRTKAKTPAAKPKTTKKRKMSTTSDDKIEDDAMDVDEPSSKSTGKKLAKKRKSDTEGEEPPAKKQKQRREDTDPWKLQSNPVKNDWTQMQAPPLEMFHFARKVVDEYTYLDGKILSMVTNINADRHWVLSGTPPIHDFGALKTIAAFLNLHLGVDDDAEGQSSLIKKRRREQTGERACPLHKTYTDYGPAVEKFHSFREVHSLEWHANRHALGQTFLDRFVRQVCARNLNST